MTIQPGPRFWLQPSPTANPGPQLSWLLFTPAVVGGLIAFGSLILPWLAIDALFVRFSLSPLELLGFEERWESDSRFYAVLGLFILLLGVIAGVTGTVGGAVGGIGFIIASKPLQLVAAISTAAAGLVFATFCVLFIVYMLWADSYSEPGAGVSVSAGVFAALFAGLVMIASGTAALIYSLVRRPR